ncbi:hypothetical protein pA_gene0008 [Aeromonas phage phiA008]|nr:hypothetical protein pA_gene0008 [Aeromonas phage phiA008]
MRIHSADIARRAGKTAQWLDNKLRWIKKYKPELWAKLDAQEAARKGHKEINTNNSQTAWTLSAAGADVFLDYLGLPRQKPEPLADILLDRRVDADELIEIMTKKLGGNPLFWRVQAARLVGCGHNASTITLTQHQAIQLLSKIWGSE